MRKVNSSLFVQIVIIIFALWLAVACTPADTKKAPETPSQKAPETPSQPTGELIIAEAALSNEALDPILGPASLKPFLLPMYDFLVGINKDGSGIDASTGVASKWESSADKKNWTFYLRSGIKFHNGMELTAEDVKFSIERVLSKRAVSPGAGHFREIISSIQVLEPYKLVINLKDAAFVFIYDVSALLGLEGAIVPKAYITEKGDEYFASHPIGSGPYKFAEQVTGDHITYEAVDKHWRVGVPKYKRITYKMVPESSTRIALLKRGGADIVSVDREQASSVKAAGFNLFLKQGSTVTTSAPCQLWDKSPIQDKNVRLAMMLALNRQEMVDTLLGGLGKVVANYPAGSYSLGYEAIEPYPYDPTRAKKLLTDAGYANGFDLNYYLVSTALTPDGPKLGEAMAGYWSKVGIRVKFIPMDYGAFRTIWSQGKLTSPAAYGVPGVGNRTFPHSVLYNTHHSKGNIPNAKIPELDNLIEKLGASLDPKEYGDWLKQVNRYMHENVLEFALFEIPDVYATSSKITNWDLGKNSYDNNISSLFTR